MCGAGNFVMLKADLSSIKQLVQGRCGAPQLLFHQARENIGNYKV